MSDDSRLILVVDDEPGSATLQRRRLERSGFRVEVAAGVDAAMTALARGGIDLVVLDYRLGTTTGLDLNRRIKAAGFPVPVIIVSAAIDDATVIEAIRAGVRDVVVKSVDYLEYLPDAVRGVLDQAAAVPERQVTPSGTRVLIVEDDRGVATLESRQLQRAGYDVEVAVTAAEALSRIREGHINLALFDLRLDNGVSGLDLYEQVKDAGWNIPAILVTAFPDQTVAIRALRAGIRDFVPKSTEYLEYLPTAVDRVVAQVRVERKLIESELRLASIIGTTMDAIVMCDDELRIVLFNRSAEDMFGCSANAAIDRRLSDFMPGLDVAGSSGHAAAGRAGAVQRRLEVEGVSAGGHRIPIEVSISDVVVHDKRLFTVIARDITERRRTEAELREADRRKDVFLGMLAHELRNPLAAITTAGEVLHRMLDHDSGRRLTTVIKRQTAALAKMVDELLDVSRVTLGKIQLAREPLLLGEIVARTTESARDVARQAGLALEVETSHEPVWLHGDPTRLEQVLTNLLTNAVKFTPAGGRIDVRAWREGDDAVIRVRDTGIGIDAELLPKIFELFVQGDTSLDRAKSGLGLGLALVRQVVTLHGGLVSASSEGPGTGSEFTVRLPIARVEGAATEPVVATVEQPSRALRVVIVDDQRDLADSVALLIDMLGHEAEAVYSGADALRTSRALMPDVMFVDIGMPGMTGYELAQIVRHDPALSHVPLVALTGYGRDEDRSRAAEAGFDLHLTKPISDARLRDVLSSIDSWSRRPH